MAVKKPSAEAEEKKKDVEQEAEVMANKAIEEQASFCAYIGPSIKGVIQGNTIYRGTRKETEERLADEIKRYPLIAKLITTDKSLAEDRIKVKTAGNLLNVYYTKLASGKSI